jgi:hypothetical protein
MSESHHDETFESADAGASLTYPQQAGTIRKNGFMVAKGRPCKVRFACMAARWRCVSVSRGARDGEGRHCIHTHRERRRLCSVPYWARAAAASDGHLELEQSAASWRLAPSWAAC